MLQIKGFSIGNQVRTIVIFLGFMLVMSSTFGKYNVNMVGDELSTVQNETLIEKMLRVSGETATTKNFSQLRFWMITREEGSPTSFLCNVMALKVFIF